MGYSPHDIITTVFRVVRNADLPEFLKLEYLKVRGGTKRGLIERIPTGDPHAILNYSLRFGSAGRKQCRTADGRAESK